MMWLYLAGLVGAIGCLALIDFRYKLAFFYDRRRTLVVLGIAMAVFIAWDLAGIALGIFFHGGSVFTLPIRLLPEFPIEELFFLLLLCYVVLIGYRFFQKRAQA